MSADLLVHTCGFLATTSQGVCGENGLFKAVITSLIQVTGSHNVILLVCEQVYKKYVAFITCLMQETTLGYLHSPLDSTDRCRFSSYSQSEV